MVKARLALVICALVGCGKSRDIGASPGDRAIGRAELSATSEAPIGENKRFARSLIQLIAQPEDYQGANVVIGGFLVLEKGHEFLGGGDGQLYLRREDYVIGMFNHVNVKLGRCRLARTAEKILDRDEGDQYSQRYVVVRGIFEPPPKDSVGPFGGTICGITSITLLLQPPSEGNAGASSIK